MLVEVQEAVSRWRGQVPDLLDEADRSSEPKEKLSKLHDAFQLCHSIWSMTRYPADEELANNVLRLMLQYAPPGLAKAHLEENVALYDARKREQLSKYVPPERRTSSAVASPPSSNSARPPNVSRHVS